MDELVWGVLCCTGFVALLVFAASPVFALSLVALFFMGMFQSIFTISIQTALQLRVPDELRGRVMGVYTLAVGMTISYAVERSGGLVERRGTISRIDQRFIWISGWLLLPRRSAQHPRA